jgi:hypothetical protein
VNDILKTDEVDSHIGTSDILEQISDTCSKCCYLNYRFNLIHSFIGNLEDDNTEEYLYRAGTVEPEGTFIAWERHCDSTGIYIFCEVLTTLSQQ